MAHGRIVNSSQSLDTHRRWWLLALAYAALIAYGSLFPITEWRAATGNIFAFVSAPLLERPSRIDMLINVLAYMPLGLTLTLALSQRRRLAGPVGATLIGAALSLAMESLQAYLPNRVQSNVDFATNAFGTLLGAIVARVWQISYALTSVTAWRARMFDDDRAANRTAVAALLWMIAQLSPLVPSFDIGQLRQGLAPVYYTLMQPSLFDFTKALEYALDMLGLGLLISVMFKPRKSVLVVFVLFVGVVLAMKAAIVGRHLTLEAIAAMAFATAVLAGLQHTALKLRSMLAVIAIITAYAIAESRPEGVLIPNLVIFHPMNWVPFKDQMLNLTGIADILDSLWPFFALGCLAFSAPHRWRPLVVFLGLIAVTVATFVLEWRQQVLPGRSADITDVIVALVGYLLVPSVGAAKKATPNPARRPAARV